MAQYHYVIGYDSDTKKWFVEYDPDAYFPDGYIFSNESAEQTGYGWMVPDEGSPEEALDHDLLNTLYSLVDIIPIPKEHEHA